MFLISSIPSLSAFATTPQPPDEPSVLPLTAADQVTIRKAGTHRDRTFSGVIEDMSGQVIVLRRGGNAIEVLKLSEVVAIRFQKSVEYDDGLRKLQNRQWQSALSVLQAAAATETRAWAAREILASQAVALRSLQRFEECLATIDRIFQDDPNTRHLVELPLVWDERLPESQRFNGTPGDLKSPSILRQLTAASALLQNPEHSAAAAAVLTLVRKSPHSRIQELAEVQLWRRRLLHPEELRETDIEQWMHRTRDFDRRMRSGAEFLIGRALLAKHDYDNASTSLLWMPMLEPLDPPTTAASLSDAITALERAGRSIEAAQFQLEFDGLTK